MGIIFCKRCRHHRVPPVTVREQSLIRRDLNSTVQNVTIDPVAWGHLATIRPQHDVHAHTACFSDSERHLPTRSAARAQQVPRANTNHLHILRNMKHLRYCEMRHIHTIQGWSRTGHPSTVSIANRWLPLFVMAGILKQAFRL